jgi:hypothetical protein
VLRKSLVGWSCAACYKSDRDKPQDQCQTYSTRHKTSPPSFFSTHSRASRIPGEIVFCSCIYFGVCWLVAALSLFEISLFVTVGIPQIRDKPQDQCQTYSTRHKTSPPSFFSTHSRASRICSCIYFGVCWLVAALSLFEISLFVTVGIIPRSRIQSKCKNRRQFPRWGAPQIRDKPQDQCQTYSTRHKTSQRFLFSRLVFL